ncbi:MAG: glycerol-3-phosphate dehydrogenase/oxidase [Bacteroidetes bacterium]|nr:MAG: glycerol-3-phosphate dehydrogenase/oxidase [Bacteroidota bacterium]
MNFLSGKSRHALLDQASQTAYDLLVIGGGATGAGIALDAASRGLKVALVDKQDFAAGTSSRSTKLIHGGLRYLKQLEFKIVRETGRERAIVHRLAPHLVVAEKMLLPLVENGTYGKALTALGLWVYDLMAGVSGDDRRRMLSKEKTLQQEPLLDKNRVLGGGYYAEYRTDDARLTLENIKTAVKQGAHCINYLTVKELLYEKEQVSGAVCQDHFSGREIQIRAKKVVSAAGPWVDEIRAINNSLYHKRLHLTKGVHIVVSRARLPLKQSVYFDVPDGRMIFAIPRGRSTYIGTTDTDYHGDINRPLTTQADVTYLLDGANALFPDAKLLPADVESSWAGLRPLIHEEGKSASELSRKDEIFVSPTGLISIAGGKLTGYRKMAQRVVSRVAQSLAAQGNVTFKPSRTHKLVLTGGDFGNAAAVDAFRNTVLAELAPLGFDAFDAGYLVHNYGRQTEDILKIFRAGTDKSGQGLILAELAFCMENELCLTICDFFIRRTGRLYFDIASVGQYAERVISEMALTYGWDTPRMAQERNELHQAVAEASRFDIAEKV